MPRGFFFFWRGTCVIIALYLVWTETLVVAHVSLFIRSPHCHWVAYVRKVKKVVWVQSGTCEWLPQHRCKRENHFCHVLVVILIMCKYPCLYIWNIIGTNLAMIWAHWRNLVLLLCSPLCINALAMFWLYLNTRTDRPVLLGIVSSGERQDPVLLVCYQVSVTRYLDTVSTKVLDSVDLNPMRALFHPGYICRLLLSPVSLCCLIYLQYTVLCSDCRPVASLLDVTCMSVSRYIHPSAKTIPVWTVHSVCVCVCLYVGRPVSGLFPVSIGQLEP